MILVCFGTRPEVIKLSPVISALQRSGMNHKLVFTGQHKELYDDVSSLIPDPDFHLNVMAHNQGISNTLAKVLRGMDEIILEQSPELIIVQGDTSTVLAAAMAGFNRQVKVGHVEAGLRTYRMDSPFPEEANRQLVSRVATFNWAPTEQAAANLKQEGIDNVWITGNTVIDACMNMQLQPEYGNEVLITLHRRENFGERMESMFNQIEQLATTHRDLEFIFPMHPNPNVQKWKHMLKNVRVVAPLPYLDLLTLLSRVRCVISDSGGIQEECAAFRKKVLVCRNTTERPEGIDAGFAKLVDTNIAAHFDWARLNPQWNGHNPYGDGRASERIVTSITEKMQV